MSQGNNLHEQVNGGFHVSGPTPPSNPMETPASSKRSEVLRHVFPSRTGTPVYRKSSPRVTKHSKPRVTFHRVITSFFNSSPTKLEEHPESTQADSGASSIRSKPESSLHGSMNSVELVSPGAFLFSGPSLRSHSGSFSNSTSRIPSFSECGSETPMLLRRIQSDSFSILDNTSTLNERILEPPSENGITRTMSDVLLGLDTPFEESEEPLMLRRKGLLIVDSAIIPLLLPYLSFTSRNSLRLTCKCWYSALKSLAPPTFPASYRLPIELLQYIYAFLSPKDFNAARHACRNWMRASLSKALLVTMLKRGGWWSGYELEDLNGSNITQPSISMSQEWSLSRRLSRECALSSSWSGNGVDHPHHTALTVVSQIDFSDLSNGSSSAGGLIFTASACGQFLLVARDTMIYIYDIRNGDLLPITSIACPRRVLSMSMDVSAGRDAIATLLEGRMGMVSELQFGRKGDESPMEIYGESHGCPSRTTTKTSILTSRASEFDSGMDVAGHMSLRRSSTHYSEEPFSSVDLSANHQAIMLEDTNDRYLHEQNQINHAWNLHLRGPLPFENQPIGPCTQSMPAESGPSTFYRHLCSEDDPPRSVAICPQRRCVAFGCSAGIELHWIDALTRQSLSRWFPLTAPSDYLHFLSPRPGFESSKKLRLISSAAHPDDRPVICRNFFHSRSTVASFWGAFGLESSNRWSGSSTCDHYHAIPLSDGHHILFLDPQNNRLYLGCDAPLGGPTKLLRKVLLIPPNDSQVPSIYSAAADLTWGARIVVAFGDTVVFYSVPPDVCALSRVEQRAESWDVYTTAPFSTEGRTKDHWLNWVDEPCPNNSDSPIWPVAIRGTELGSIHGICELAIRTQPEIIIWAFTLDAQCRIWRLRSSWPSAHTRRFVCRNGIIHNECSIDATRDVIMTDVAPLPLPPEPEVDVERSVGYDGHCSQIIAKRIPRALNIENDEWVDFVDVRGCEAWYDANGDVVMFKQDISGGW